MDDKPVDRVRKTFWWILGLFLIFTVVPSAIYGITYLVGSPIVIVDETEVTRVVEVTRQVITEKEVPVYVPLESTRVVEIEVTRIVTETTIVAGDTVTVEVPIEVTRLVYVTPEATATAQEVVEETTTLTPVINVESNQNGVQSTDVEVTNTPQETSQSPIEDTNSLTILEKFVVLFLIVVIVLFIIVGLLEIFPNAF